jgi:hypothetical protein
MIVDPTAGGASSVTGAIRHAAQATGASFEYLLATARVESSLNPNAKASTTTARGLYQFIEQTWLETMKRAGATHGYAHYANAITRSDSGRYVVQDAALKTDILKLRSDPTANALMAGAFTNRNSELLSSRLGRAPTEGELYMAHFLGPSGAARLITLADRNPDFSAAAAFRNAARANRSIFFDRGGNARGASDVTSVLTARYAAARARQAPTAIAQAKDAIEPAGVPAVAVPVAAAVVAPVAAASTVAEPARIAAAGTVAEPARVSGAFTALASSSAPPPRVASVRPVFPNLFSVSERRDPVAPFVKELWGAPAQRSPAPYAALAAPAAEVPAPEPAAGAPLDLFRDLKPDIRALFRRSA